MGTGGDAIHLKLDEAAILADIRYFEDKVHELDAATSGQELAMRRVYQGLLIHRRQILAAWRDGCPDRWYDYDHVA
jgi:phage-related tail fiber protein